MPTELFDGKGITDLIGELFSTSHFMPHGHCYLWDPRVLTLHIVSDALITLAYFSIPFTLLYFVRKRKAQEFNWIFLCFAIFIVACGATHLMEIWVIWHPTYWLSGAIKALTALASVPTAILLVKLIPTALQLPSPTALRTANAGLRALSARLQSVREQEATRIAREIHDELGQRLTGLKLDLLWTERKLGELAGSAEVNALLDRVVGATELVDGITTVVQEIATELRPVVLDKLGLGSALQQEARRFQERTRLICDIRVPETEPALSPELATTLFRIFQECLTNVARHAGASEVLVELKMEDEWAAMRVQDNGRGITETELANPKALGLVGMKERAALLGGEILFQRGPANGTMVTTRMPRCAAALPRKEPA